ncbi:hypothetical protein ACQKDB_16000 [Planococcus kocurii]|uniref:hypothetical protein n=1 Tax=Planococcus kocurii TaxID=1374 RepID=UPI003D07B2D7
MERAQLRESDMDLTSPNYSFSYITLTRSEGMGSFHTKFTYRQLLTIKHALLYYMKRENQSDADWDSEKALHSKVKEQIKMAEEKMKSKQKE